MAVLMTSGGVIPATGKLLSDYAEGDIVKLNENGSPVEFYVAKHDYESGLNGAGRTLLVRKDCYDMREWHIYTGNPYASSTIDTWLNGTYKSLLDADVQSVIVATKFYYTPGGSDYTVTTLSRAIFLLSVTELGKASSYNNTEGSALPIASTLQTAYLNGSGVEQWTRSPYTKDNVHACVLSISGKVAFFYCDGVYGSRPAFTLSGNAKFDPETNEFMKG